MKSCDLNGIEQLMEFSITTVTPKRLFDRPLGKFWLTPCDTSLWSSSKSSPRITIMHDEFQSLCLKQDSDE